MNLFKSIKSLFSAKELSEDEKARRIIKKMGYKSEGSDAFVKKRGGRTWIWITKEGVRIKVYMGVYAESAYLSRPIESKRLIDFIRSNQL
ncbi:MAG: hypothetical protein HOK65_03660 [Crocinitomicaceae bacterium]|nr:hypothetical protein [Crocinitomicaceae bacterium]